MKKRTFLFCLIASITFFSSHKSYAHTYYLPGNGDAVVGKVQWTQTRPGDDFIKVGRRYDIGYFEMVEANPGIDPDHLQPGTLLVVPTKFIIPHVPHVGVVLNIAELRLFYFPPGGQKVLTYPVGIGREGWGTPLGVTKITTKIKNPTWIPTESIRQWHKENFGNTLPDKVPPGPDNPLGVYAMYLGFPLIRMHGTNDPAGIGRRSSSGCIRMWPEDVKELYGDVRVGTQVRVINTPYKAGWLHNRVYLESHVPLQEQQHLYSNDLSPMRYDIHAITLKRSATINWDDAENVAIQQNGIPQVVGRQ